MTGSPYVVVRVGNADALEAVMVRDPDSGQVQKIYSGVPGERVTVIHLDAALPRMLQMNEVISFLREMMNPMSRPWWIESDDQILRDMLCQHYGLALTSARPVAWGDGTTTAPPDPPKPKKQSKAAAGKGN